jgi:hypothetical protein
MPTLDDNLNRLNASEARDAVIRVRVVSFNIPFFQMVWLLIKFAFAAIPAAIVFGALVALVTAALGMIFGGVFTGILSGFHWI